MEKEVFVRELYSGDILIIIDVLKINAFNFRRKFKILSF